MRITNYDSSVRRGEIHWVTKQDGQGYRPVLIISSNETTEASG